MDTTQAWELLNDQEYVRRLSMVEFRDLLIRAGYEAKEVRRLSKQRGWERLSAGEMV